MTDFDVDKLSDYQLGTITGSFLRTGDALAAARAANGEVPSHGVTFMVGLWLGVVIAKEPKYGTAMREVLAKIQSKTSGKPAEQVESEALQIMRDALKGTIFENDLNT